MTIRQQIAAAAGISAGRVTQIAAAGCPVDNVDSALAWIREHVRRHDNRPVELPPDAAKLRVGPKARLERATDAERVQHALWRAAVESGTATPRTIADLHGVWAESRKQAALGEKEYSEALLRLKTTLNANVVRDSLRQVAAAIKQDFSTFPWGAQATEILRRHLATAAGLPQQLSP